MSDLVIGDDGLPRCAWGADPEIYRQYHDEEWARPTTDEVSLFEKICLEGFQSGLSWLTILRKRPAFRTAFHNFDPHLVAGMGPDQVSELLDNAAIIRHRGKIEATINNAQRLLTMHDDGTSLREIFWESRPEDRVPPVSFADVPSVTDQSTALSKKLKKLGFKFVGPTTCYAALQAMGVVNDHLTGCYVRTDVEAAQVSILDQSHR